MVGQPVGQPVGESVGQPVGAMFQWTLTYSAHFGVTTSYGASSERVQEGNEGRSSGVVQDHNILSVTCTCMEVKPQIVGATADCVKCLLLGMCAEK